MTETTKAKNSTEATTEASTTEAPYIGGSYEDCLKEKKNRDNSSELCVHHLIAKAALSKWLPFTHADDPYWDELLTDSWQKWAPSIVMTVEDHKKTWSYYEQGMGAEQYRRAQWYVNRQATDIIYCCDFIGALNREKEILTELFGSKYIEACDQAIRYTTDVLKVERTPDYRLHFGDNHIYDYYRIPTRPRKK